MKNGYKILAGISDEKILGSTGMNGEIITEVLSFGSTTLLHRVS
jgi:hypothetical protein